jgi:hypothetical protein
LSFKPWDHYTFQTGGSCAVCTQMDEVVTYVNLHPRMPYLTSVLQTKQRCGLAQRGSVVPSHFAFRVLLASGYLALLTAGISEGTVAISYTCTADQIANTAGTDCTSAQRGTSAKCRCCNPFSTCASALAPESSNVMAIISYLGMLDRGVRVRSASGYTLLYQTEVYTPLMYRRTVRELLFGSASATSGFFQVQSSWRTFPSLCRCDEFVHRHDVHYCDVFINR